MTDLVGNPVDRFFHVAAHVTWRQYKVSHDAAHIKLQVLYYFVAQNNPLFKFLPISLLNCKLTKNCLCQNIKSDLNMYGQKMQEVV